MQYVMKAETALDSICQLTISKAKFFEAYEMAKERDYRMRVYGGVDYHGFVFTVCGVKFSYWAVEV